MKEPHCFFFPLVIVMPALVLGLCGAACGPAHAAESTGGASDGAVTVSGLQCEYLKNPLGLGARQPRLSWVLSPSDPKSRGTRQTAYQVLVATKEELLRPGTADLWDSGEVKSGQSLQVVYGGKPLGPGLVCFWTVRVRNQTGQWSAWSARARWTMGPLEASDWTAKWIGTDQVFARKPGWPPPDNAMPDPWFRKSFELEKAPTRAVMHVASIGYHELYVNGHKAGDAVLSPCVSDHNKRARYVTYDIASSLRPGRNVIGLWLGTSWSIFPHYKAKGKPSSPIAIAQADIELGPGKSVRIVTDETWRTRPSPNTLVGVWDFMHYGGELYDASKELPGWCEPGLDDSSWKPASVFQPEVVLSAQQVEPNRVIKEIRPVGITEPSPGVYRIDMGVNFTGWIEANVAGQAGDKIEFKFSERANEAMTHRLHSFYIIGPSGKGTFRNRFNYSVGRWIQIEGLRQRPRLEDVRGWFVRTDYSRATQFECSDKLLNDIYQATLWTFENLSLGGYVVDCAQRERMGYGGDAHATTETALDNYRLGAFYTKWSEDWRDVQGKDGNLPYTAPTYWGGGGPGWSGYCVTLPWEVYRRYEDTRILEENLPVIQRWLAFLETKAKNNMLVRWGGEWDFLGDWLWPGAEGVNGDTRETLFFNNCYWIYNLQTAARIADALGKADLASAWRARAQTVRAAVHKEFFQADSNSYVNGFQAYLSIALLVGLPPEELRNRVWKRLEDEITVVRKSHFHGGITGGSFIVKNLLAAERPDLMHAMATKTDYPGWGDMLKRGATTLWEDWEGKLSLSHSSYLHIGMWFVEGLAGIRPDPNGAGFRKFVLRPGVLPADALQWVKASFESPYGPIECAWRIEAGKLRLETAVPANTSCTLHLPTARPQSIREGSLPVARSKGVSLLGESPKEAVLSLEPGRYSFEADR